VSACHACGGDHGEVETRHTGGDGGAHHREGATSVSYTDNDGIPRAMTPAEAMCELQRYLDEIEFGS
jgi:hypothetical protein